MKKKKYNDNFQPRIRTRETRSNLDVDNCSLMFQNIIYRMKPQMNNKKIKN